MGIQPGNSQLSSTHGYEPIASRSADDAGVDGIGHHAVVAGNTGLELDCYCHSEGLKYWIQDYRQAHEADSRVSPRSHVRY